MRPTPYPELNRVLGEFVSRLDDVLTDGLVGVYLQGSFALGDFDEHSDVDFIAVLRDELSLPQVQALQAMHGGIFDLGPEWARHLEGSYFPRATLQNRTSSGGELWYLDHGARTLILSDHCNTLLVRWVVREKGVVLKGPPPRTLLDPVPAEALRQEMFAVMVNWGQEILADPDRWSNRFYQGYLVLNYGRMLHDLRRGYPGSKRAGAEWAKRHLDPAWAPLIDAAWDCRPDPARQVRQPADPEAYALTLRFIDYVMGEARRYMAEQGLA